MSLSEKNSPEKISISQLVEEILKNNNFKEDKNSLDTTPSIEDIQEQVIKALKNKYSDEYLELSSDSQRSKLKEDIKFSIQYVLSQNHENWNEGAWQEETLNALEINQKFLNQIDLKKVLELLGKEEKNNLSYYLEKIGTREFKEIAESIGWRKLIKEVKKEGSHVLNIYLKISPNIKKSIISEIGVKKLFQIFVEFEKTNFFEFFKIPERNLELLRNHWGWNGLFKGFNPFSNTFTGIDNFRNIQFLQKVSIEDLEELGNILGWESFRKKLFKSRLTLNSYPLVNKKNSKFMINLLGKEDFIKLFTKKHGSRFIMFLERSETDTLSFFIDYMGIKNLMSITRDSGFSLMNHLHNIKPETTRLLLEHNFDYKEAKKKIFKNNFEEKNKDENKSNKIKKYSELSMIQKLRQNKERRNIFNKIGNDHRITSINLVSSHLENLKFFSKYPQLLDEILSDRNKSSILRKNPELTIKFFQNRSESEIRNFINKTGTQLPNTMNAVVSLSNILDDNQHNLIWDLITKKLKNSRTNYQILQDALNINKQEDDKNNILKQWIIFIIQNRKNKCLEYLSLIGELSIFGISNDIINSIGEIFLPLENKNNQDLENLFQTDKNKLTKFEKALTIFLRENNLQLDKKKQRQIKNNLNQLKNKKSDFNEAALKSLTKILEPEILKYFKNIRNKQIEKSLKMQEGSINIHNLKPHFMIFYKMVLSTGINRRQGLKLIQEYLKKSCYDEENTKNIFETYPYTEEKNKEFIVNNFPNKKKRNFWFSGNKEEFEIKEEDSQEKISTKRIQQHINVILNILKNYTDIPDLTNHRTILDNWKNSQKTLREKLKNEDFLDLKTQINAIRKIRENKNIKKIKKITIERELDPSKIAMMGEWVDGSCLAYGGMNYFSAISNAIDVNKAVFYIKDENGNILGRVLCAIPKKGKLIRFPLYQKGNTNVDLDKYFNQYIQEISKNSGLTTTNKNLKYEVQELVSEQWYKDPQGKF